MEEAPGRQSGDVAAPLVYHYYTQRFDKAIEIIELVYDSDWPSERLQWEVLKMRILLSGDNKISGAFTVEDYVKELGLNMFLLRMTTEGLVDNLATRRVLA